MPAANSPPVTCVLLRVQQQARLITALLGVPGTVASPVPIENDEIMRQSSGYAGCNIFLPSSGQRRQCVPLW